MTFRNRRGLSLIELVLALVIVGIIGAAFTRLLTSQGRFFDTQNALRSARSVSRGGLNVLLSDLRSIETDGGMKDSNRDSLYLWVPYGFGLLCRGNPTEAVMSLQPLDSAVWANAGFSGFAWRDHGGGYVYTVTRNMKVEPPATWSNHCGNGNPSALISTLPGGRVITAKPGPTSPVTAGYAVLVFQKIVYKFGPSKAVPGARALWRTVVDHPGGPQTEELAAPFDTSAQFRFFNEGADTSQTTLGNGCWQHSVTREWMYCNARGVELILDGLSERTPGGSPGPKQSQYRTAVFFQNRMP
jgi:prepilin-type N-terminal cleavage/methylation domain-containing protein